MKNQIEINSQFGHLLVVGETRDKYGNKSMLCKCDCGTHVPVGKVQLLRGRKTCGRQCPFFRNNLLARLTTHGLTHHPAYTSWYSLKTRCYNPKDKRYKDYGGRGITVDPKWMTFSGFWADMGASYEAGKSIDRINNDKGYYKENCRWATLSEQANNKRNTVKILTSAGKMTITQAAEHFGIPRSNLQDRLQRGWSVQRALSTPINIKHRRNANTN